MQWIDNRQSTILFYLKILFGQRSIVRLNLIVLQKKIRFKDFHASHARCYMRWIDRFPQFNIFIEEDERYFSNDLALMEWKNKVRNKNIRRSRMWRVEDEARLVINLRLVESGFHCSRCKGSVIKPRQEPLQSCRIVNPLLRNLIIADYSNEIDKRLTRK